MLGFNFSLNKVSMDDVDSGSWWVWFERKFVSCRSAFVLLNAAAVSHTEFELL